MIFTYAGAYETDCSRGDVRGVWSSHYSSPWYAEIERERERDRERDKGTNEALVTGAMMPQFSYLGCTIFPPCHEPLIDSAYHGSEFDGEMVSGSQLASNWENDPPSDQDSEIFFDGA